VQFFDCYGPSTVEEEWFDDQPNRTSAHAVVVAGGGDTAGIDAALTSNVPPPPAPHTTITAGPSGITTSPSASFGFASSEAGSTFECSLDGSSYEPCTSPTTYPQLAEGTHTFLVRATSPAGEVDRSPAQRTWVVDTFAPVLEIHRPRGGPYVNDQSVGETGPTVVVGSVRVEATAFDNESGVPAFRFEVDGIPVDPAAVTHQGPIYRFTYRPATPGEHTIGAVATNGSGLTSAVTISVLGVPAG